MSSPLPLIEELDLLTPSPAISWTWVAASVFALALAIYLWRRLRPRHANSSSVSQPAEAPDAVALRELRKLEQHVEEFSPSVFALRASLILRDYIEGSFELRAAHESTEEFLDDVLHSPEIPGLPQASLREFLCLCDLSKFAQRDLRAESKQALLVSARNLITESSRPLAEATR